MGNDGLDRLIDEGLRSYVGTPRPGIERRVLNQIAVAPVASRWPFARWIFAAAALSCAIAVLVRPVHQPVGQRPHQETARVEIIPEAPQIPVQRHVKSRRRRRFESREPLSDQERALLTLVERAPFQAEEILTIADPTPVEPIKIQEITIAPLQ